MTKLAKDAIQAIEVILDYVEGCCNCWNLMSKFFESDRERKEFVEKVRKDLQEAIDE